MHAWWGSNLPNYVTASLDPVVQEGETSIGDKIGETHVCDWNALGMRRIEKWCWEVEVGKRKDKHRIKRV